MMNETIRFETDKTIDQKEFNRLMQNIHYVCCGDDSSQCWHVSNVVYKYLSAKFISKAAILLKFEITCKTCGWSEIYNNVTISTYRNPNKFKDDILELIKFYEKFKITVKEV